jgi:uncharacterized protein (DUF58 family)
MGLAGLIIVLLAIAFLLRLDFIYYIVYVCVGIFILSRWAVPHALDQLRLRRKFTDHAFLGETVTICIQWHNKGWLPLPWVEFSESIPPGLRIGEPVHQVITLAGRQERERNYQVQAGRRGYYCLGPLRLTTGDLFGLVSGKTGYLEPDYLTVYPRIISLTRLGLPSRLPFGTIASRQRLFEDPARPMGVRDYNAGDSQRHINWKVSAHTDRLLVKRFQPAISLETAILLNLHTADYQQQDWRYHTEWAIVTATSLATHLIEQRQPTGLRTNGIDPLQRSADDDMELQFHEDSGRLMQQQGSDGSTVRFMPPPIPPRNDREHLMKILERLARIESDNTIPFNQWAATACLNLSWGVTILAITSRGDEATCHALHRLVRSGFNPILIVVEGDRNFGLVRERARRLGFRAYNVTGSSNLDLWRHPKRQPNL